ncbi:Rab family GTPase [Entamoeba marina]
MSKRTLKHCMLGETSVGKTCIVLRYVNQVFDPKSKSTLGVNFITKKCDVKNHSVLMNIWDTAGSEKFRSMTSMYYRKATSCMIVYDITNRKSFEGIEEWYNKIREEEYNSQQAIIMIIGAKNDLGRQREVSKEEGECMARSLDCLFMEVSSKTGENIDLSFKCILDNIDLNNLEDNSLPVLSDGDSSCC